MMGWASKSCSVSVKKVSVQVQATLVCGRVHSHSPTHNSTYIHWSLKPQSRKIVQEDLGGMEYWNVCSQSDLIDDLNFQTRGALRQRRSRPSVQRSLCPSGSLWPQVSILAKRMPISELPGIKNANTCFWPWTSRGYSDCINFNCLANLTQNNIL